MTQKKKMWANVFEWRWILQHKKLEAFKSSREKSFWFFFFLFLLEINLFLSKSAAGWWDVIKLCSSKFCVFSSEHRIWFYLLFSVITFTPFHLLSFDVRRSMEWLKDILLIKVVIDPSNIFILLVATSTCQNANFYHCQLFELAHLLLHRL